MSYDASLALQGEVVYGEAPEAHASLDDVAKVLSTPYAWRKVFEEGLKVVLESQLKSLDDHNKDSDDVLTKTVAYGYEMLTLTAEQDDVAMPAWLFATFFDGLDWPRENQHDD